MGLYESKPLKVSHDPAKFGGDKHCGRGDIMILICHVISQDHVTLGSCDFMGRSPLRNVTNLYNLVAITTMVVEI